MCRQCGSWSVADHYHRNVIGRDPICASYHDTGLDSVNQAVHLPCQAAENCQSVVQRHENNPGAASRVSHPGRRNCRRRDETGRRAAGVQKSSGRGRTASTRLPAPAECCAGEDVAPAAQHLEQLQASADTDGPVRLTACRAGRSVWKTGRGHQSNVDRCKYCQLSSTKDASQTIIVSIRVGQTKLMTCHHDHLATA